MADDVMPTHSEVEGQETADIFASGMEVQAPVVGLVDVLMSPNPLYATQSDPDAHETPSASLCILLAGPPLTCTAETPSLPTRTWSIPLQVRGDSLLSQKLDSPPKPERAPVRRSNTWIDRESP